MENLTCFKTYDIRGQLGTNLNASIAYRIARAYAEYLKPKSVVVGGDIRLSTPELKNTVITALTDAGVNVIDLGLTGTEEVYFATNYFKADGGIEITASHNPIDWNGMKLVKQGAKPIGKDTGLQTIKQLAKTNQFTNQIEKGTVSSQSALKAYIEHLLSYITLSTLQPMKLVVNAGNGAAGHVIDAIETTFNKQGIPITFFKVNHNPDGSFPNGVPNPLLPENHQQTAQVVKAQQANLGIAWDGDFDRCFFFDENGRFIEGYYIVGLLAEAFLKSHPGEKIIHDPRLSWNTIETVTHAGGKAIVSKTGHAFMKEKMREENALYGGEMSAHHYFRDFAYCDSGMIPWLILIELLSKSGKPLSALVQQAITAFPASGEINMTVNNPSALLDEVCELYSQSAIHIDRLDGINIEYTDWRFNLRCSNTEPLVRLNVEARGNKALMEEKTSELLAFIKTFSGSN